MWSLNLHQRNLVNWIDKIEVKSLNFINIFSMDLEWTGSDHIHLFFIKIRLNSNNLVFQKINDKILRLLT